MITQSIKNIFLPNQSNKNQKTTPQSTLSYESYMSKRSNIIQILESLCSKLKFRNQTLYLALYLIDIIYVNKRSKLDYELTSVSCLLLAGRFLIIIMIIYMIL